MQWITQQMLVCWNGLCLAAAACSPDVILAIKILHMPHYERLVRWLLLISTSAVANRTVLITIMSQGVSPKKAPQGCWAPSKFGKGLLGCLQQISGSFETLQTLPQATPVKSGRWFGATHQLCHTVS